VAFYFAEEVLVEAKLCKNCIRVVINLVAIAIMLKYVALVITLCKVILLQEVAD